MQSVTVDVFLSVDGWAGSEKSPGYFGYFGPQLDEWINSELEKPQLVLMGRRTYDALSELPDEAKDEGWQRMNELDKVVFSRTLQEVDWDNTRICADDAVQQVARLKAEGDRPMRTMGSLSIARQLLDAGLVDRLRLMTFPLLVGPMGRDPFFDGVHAEELELVDYRVWDNRIVLLEYRPTGNSIPGADA